MNIIFCYYAVNTFSFHALISNKPTPSAPPPPPKKVFFFIFLCSSNLVHKAAKSQCIRDSIIFPIITNEYCYLLIWKEITLCFFAEKEKEKKKLARHSFQSTHLAKTPNHCQLPQSLSPSGADTEWFCGLVVPCLCGSRSTRPLINRLELLTGGSSIPHYPCHFHYCISIMPHFRDKARKRRRAGQKTSSSLAF